LFVIFINDIDLAVDAMGFIVKFADDSKAGRVVDSQEDRIAFQEMLDRLETWSQEWQLLFNRGKC
jgi:ribonuclease P/MRP protein subunit RPP40